VLHIAYTCIDPVLHLELFLWGVPQYNASAALRKCDRATTVLSYGMDSGRALSAGPEGATGWSREHRRLAARLLSANAPGVTGRLTNLISTTRVTLPRNSASRYRTS